MGMGPATAADNMRKSMQRIFLTTSHLSTVFITLYAKQTQAAGVNDILLIDHAPKKQSLVRHVKETAALHAWHQVIDLSLPVPDSHSVKITFLKTATRHLKHKPVFKPVYNLLYKRQQARSVKSHIGLLRYHIDTTNERTVLHLMTETMLNEALCELFPRSQVNYFEHGLSDYLLAGERLKENTLFYCVFAEQYKSYLEKGSRPADFVRAYFDPVAFEAVCNSFYEDNREVKTLKDVVKPEGKYCLLLLQNLEMYQVKANFWGLYLDRCLRHLEIPDEYTFLIKPHPNQSYETLREITDFFKTGKVKHKVLSDAAAAQMSIELAFSLLREKVYYVFSPFSSAVFYLSRLYPQKHTAYCYSYQWFKNEHLEKAPPQFRSLFLSAEELIRDVFSANCKEI